MKRKKVILGLSILISGLIIVSYFAFFNQDDLIIVVGTETPPFECYNNNHELVGIDVEFIESISNKLGLKYKVQLLDWDEAIEAIKNDKADIILEAGYKEERESFISYRDEHRDFNNGGALPEDTLWIAVENFFYKEGEKYNLTSYETIKENNYRVGIVNGYSYFDGFFDNKLNFYSYPSSERLIYGLDDGEIDILIMDAFEFYSLVKKLNLKNNIIKDDLNLNIGANFILFSKKYDNPKYAKIKEDFYTELIRLKNEENLHEKSYTKYTGKNFSETYGNFI